MQQFALAMQDLNFVKYQQKQYDNFVERIEELKTATKNSDDSDI